MNDPTYMAAFFGALLTVVMATIWRRRIKTKIFVGDGGDPELKESLAKFNDIFKHGAIGLLLLYALNAVKPDNLFYDLFQTGVSFLLFMSLVPMGAAKRANGTMSFSYVIQRGIFIAMTGATSLYLIYLWAAPEFAD